MTDVLLIEIGPHGLIWIEPIWKEHSSFEAIRSAYAVIANSDFIGGPVSGELLRGRISPLIALLK